MSEGSRLSRWSQRKLAVSRGGALPEPDDIAARPIADDKIRPANDSSAVTPERKAPADSASLPDGGVSDANLPEGEEMLAEADLPPIEELTAGSDYTVFLKKNVPEMLRRRALRKLWVSDPVLANLDGLNDYDDDYTIVHAMTMDDTIYKVGRGFLTDEPEVVPEAELESGLESAAEPGIEPTAIEGGDSQTATDEAVETAAGETVDQDNQDDEDNEEIATGNSDAPPVAATDALPPVGTAEAEVLPEPATSAARNRADTST